MHIWLYVGVKNGCEMEYGGFLIQINFDYGYSSDNLFNFFKTSWVTRILSMWYSKFSHVDYKVYF